MNEKKRMNILAGISSKSIIEALEFNAKKNKVLEAIEIIDKYEYLQKSFKYIILNNKSNDGPYHNLNHLLTVLKYCYLGALSEKINDEKELRELLIAAIFHDVNHTVGKEKDDVNVQNSKNVIKKFVQQEKIDVDIDYINKLLDATQYPYVIESADLDLRQSIIRDADLMQVFEYNWIHQNIAGLSSELKMDFLDFVQPQRKFLESASFNTDWGKSMYKDKWNDVMKQYEMFERACNVNLNN